MLGPLGGIGTDIPAGFHTGNPHPGGVIYGDVIIWCAIDAIEPYDADGGYALCEDDADVDDDEDGRRPAVMVMRRTTP